MTDKTHYDALGLERNATPEEIKAAYRRMRGGLHPDREGGDDEAMRAVNAAYTVLSDPKLRAAYDLTLPDEERDALEHVAALLEKHCTGPTDPIAASVLDITAEMEKIAAARAHNEHILANLRKHLKRTKFTGEGLNVAEVQMRRQIEKIEAMKPLAARIESTLHRALDMLQNYEYEMPAQPFGTTYGQMPWGDLGFPTNGGFFR